MNAVEKSQSVFIGQQCPPVAFAIVRRNVYRSNIFAKHNFSFIKQLNLTTILYFSQKDPPKQLIEFSRKNNIRLIRLWDDFCGSKARILSDDVIKTALELILDHAHHPLMFCCDTGIQYTGIITGCLRKVERWTIPVILEEYNRFAGNKRMYLAEQFIELFDKDLVSTSTISGFDLD